MAVKEQLLLRILKQALPYLRRHRGQVMVVKLGGEIAANTEALRSLAEDISLLSHVGIRCVVVHGGGPQATELSRRLGMVPTLVQGRRVTDDQTLDVAKMVFAGKINVDITSALRTQGVQAVGMSGVAADILHAARRAPTEITDEVTGEKSMVDFGHVGDITSVNTGVLSLLMENGYVPVLSSLGSDGDGNILNINADTVSAAVAADLQAGKLIILTSVAGVLADKQDPDSLVSLLTVGQVNEALSTGAIAGGMRPKLAALARAVATGVGRGHILSGLQHGSLLLELFTRAGAGTLIVREDDQAAHRAPSTLPFGARTPMTEDAAREVAAPEAGAPEVAPPPGQGETAP